MINDAWADFIFLVHQTRIHNQVARLLEAGWANIEALKKLGQAERVWLQPGELARCYLPWYETPLGSCPWSTPRAEPLSIHRWSLLYCQGEDVPGKDRVEHLAKTPQWIGRDGPLLVIEDTSLGVRLVAEGSKRACAAVVTAMPIQAVLFRSLYSHALFPSDFLPHILKLKCQ